jgi:hypothetical protein
MQKLGKEVKKFFGAELADLDRSHDGELPFSARISDRTSS